MPVMDIECRSKKCPVFNQCAFLPTSFFPINDKVDILFVGNDICSKKIDKGLPFISYFGKRLRNIIIKSKNEINQPFGVAFANTIKDEYQENIINENIINECKFYLFRDIRHLKNDYGLKVIITLSEYSKSIFLEKEITNMKNIYTVRRNEFGSIIVKPSLDFSEHNFNNQTEWDNALIDDIKESVLRANM
jgi:uracil-DNA glycosylase